MGKKAAITSFDDLVAKQRVAYDRMTDQMVLGSTSLATGELLKLTENAERWVYESKCVDDCEFFVAEHPSRPARCPFFRADRAGKRTCAGYKKDKVAIMLRDWEDVRRKAELFQRDLAAYRETGGLPVQDGRRFPRA